MNKRMSYETASVALSRAIVFLMLLLLLTPPLWAESWQERNESYLREQARNPGVMQTSEGVLYRILHEGNGSSPKRGERVTLHYTQTLIDGSLVDSSQMRQRPVTVTDDRVIPGLAIALSLMREGGRYRVWIPASLAYGSRSAGERIPEFSALVFEIQVLEIGGR